MDIVITRREFINIPDGINTHIFTLANYWASQGHMVHIVSSEKPERDRINQYYDLSHGIKFYGLSKKQRMSSIEKLGLWCLYGRKIINQLNPDIIIVNGTIPVKLQSFTIHVSHDLERVGKFKFDCIRVIYKIISYRFADRIVATTNEIKEGLSREIRKRKIDIAVIPTAYNLTKYGMCNFHDRKNAILHMGTVSYKNPIATIKAFSSISMMKNYKLLITGEINRDIQLYVSSLGKKIRDNIKLLGFISESELLEMLCKVKVVSVPSVYSYPVASPSVIESLASGTPVVTTSGISKDVVKDMYNAIIINPEDSDNLAHIFEELLTDQKLWHKYSQNALNSVNKFDVSIIANNYISLYTRSVQWK